jgi:hypothetical protein
MFGSEVPDDPSEVFLRKRASTGVLVFNLADSSIAETVKKYTGSSDAEEAFKLELATVRSFPGPMEPL